MGREQCCWICAFLNIRSCQVGDWLMGLNFTPGLRCQPSLRLSTCNDLLERLVRTLCYLQMTRRTPQYLGNLCAA